MRYSPDQILKCIEHARAMPTDISRVFWDNHILYKIPAPDLSRMLAALPTHVTQLWLSNNDFDKIPVNDLIQVFRAIPAGVTSLDVSNNHLYRIPIDDLIEVLRAIPANVTTLHLEWNHLRLILDDGSCFISDYSPIIKMLVAIPATVTTLTLCERDKEAILKAINKAIRYITESMNHDRREMAHEQCESYWEAVLIDRVNNYIAISPALFRIIPSICKESIDSEHITCARNEFYSAFLLLLFNPEVITENRDAIDDCLSHITMIDDIVLLECASRLINASPKKFLNNPLFAKLLLKCNLASDDAKRFCSKLLHDNANSNEVFSPTYIHRRANEIIKNAQQLPNRHGHPHEGESNRVELTKTAIPSAFFNRNLHNVDHAGTGIFASPHNP